MYAADVDQKIKEFLHQNNDKIGRLYNVNSSASGASTYKKIKIECDKYGIAISDKEYHTVASWLFLNKNRPNKADFDRLEIFLKETIINN